MLDSFSRFMKTPAEYFAKSSGWDSSGVPNDGWSASAYKTAYTCFYVGSQAEAIVSERLRASVSAVIICYSADKPATTDLIKANDRFFVVQGIDDVAYQGQVCVVALGERS